MKSLLPLAAVSLALAAPPPKVDFQREVRPILSDACFHCHGPDNATRMAGLRLDTRDGATGARKSGVPVVPGKPAESLLWQRVHHANANLRMPPSHSKKELTAAQKDTLKRWIEQGAPWQEQWSFAPPVKRTAPASRWGTNEIDRFVAAKLAEAGLKPAAEADRWTLARRASLDLTGLPADPELAAAFVHDKSAGAYERYVDQLLASPAWGEHRARYWLDAARYADTHGLHVDNYREMWPYRDWVIRAFNSNMPFDRFTVEQVAGDLLPNRTLDQQIASGFQRCNVTTNEAGVILDEVEAIYAKDRADTIGAVFMGLTVGCASCHDHKFDPIRQRDFYALTAFFRNTTQRTMDGNVPDSPPIVIVPRDEDRDRWLAVRAEIEAARDQYAGLIKGATASEWIGTGAWRDVTSPLQPGAELVQLDPKKVANDTLTVGEGPVPGLDALHFTSKDGLDLPSLPFDGGQPFSIATWVYVPKSDDGIIVAAQWDPEEKGRGWYLEIAGRIPGFRLVGDNGRGVQIRSGHSEPLEPGWNHLTAVYDGSREFAGLAIYVNGREVPTQGAGTAYQLLTGSALVNRPLEIGHMGTRSLAGGALADFRILNRAVTVDEARLLALWSDARRAGATMTADQTEAWTLYWLMHHNAPFVEAKAHLAKLTSEQREIRRRGAITHVMQEKETDPMAHVLFRGMYDQPRDKVTPETPSSLPPMTSSMPRNRLGLAQWLVDPANPLTARVTVNRIWQEVFGTGLVKTAEDFGSQGEPPVNQALLDWLAVDFVESGWDVKRLYKQLVMSAAYRQSAAATPDKLAKDPENRLLSRGPRFRMDGEMVRDYALAASGLLTRKIGGPSVKPYQPDGIWETVAMLGSDTRFYERDSGAALYRRSLYTFWKRSAPPASMEIFNAPSRENCTVRRERTNTPLQALVTMNDPQFVEAARVLAGRAMEQSADTDGRIRYVAERLLGRPMDAAEAKINRAAFDEYVSAFGQDPASAKELISTGEAPLDAAADPAQLAALTMVASQVMNLDEVLNK